MTHFVWFNESDVVLDKLQCLDGLYKMLLVKILLLVPSIILLCHFCYKLGQSISGALLLNFLLLSYLIIYTITHDQRISVSSLPLVALEAVFEVVGARVLDAVHARRVLLERGRVAALRRVFLLVVVLDAELLEALVVLEVDVRVVHVCQLVFLILFFLHLELVRLSAGLNLVVVVHKRGGL